MRSKMEILKSLTDKMLDTYATKNTRYGDSFAQTREEYPEAICVRLSDKLSRLKTLKRNPDMSYDDESIKDTLLDLANYALMELMEIYVDEAHYAELRIRSCFDDCYESEEPNDYEYESPGTYIKVDDSHCCGSIHQCMTDTDDSIMFQGKTFSSCSEDCCSKKL